MEYILIVREMEDPWKPAAGMNILLQLSVSPWTTMQGQEEDGNSGH